jgi:hypothetical protein
MNFIYNNQLNTPQIVYDSFNQLVFSDDTRVIHKMIKKIEIYNNIKHLNGDIFEFGVFKGASVALWLQLIKLYEYNGLTSVVGFDFFNTEKLLETLEGDNNSLMSAVVNRATDKNDLEYDNILNKCNTIIQNRLKLIKGDACNTCIKFKEENPGVRIKLLYLDMDLDKPTYIVLKNLWDNVVLHGLIVLDEYGYHKWDESNGVDRFLKSIPGKYICENSNIKSPTLIIRKINY